MTPLDRIPIAIAYEDSFFGPTLLLVDEKVGCLAQGLWPALRVRKISDATPILGKLFADNLSRAYRMMST